MLENNLTKLSTVENCDMLNIMETRLRKKCSPGARKIDE